MGGGRKKRAANQNRSEKQGGNTHQREGEGKEGGFPSEAGVLKKSLGRREEDVKAPERGKNDGKGL